MTQDQKQPPDAILGPAEAPTEERYRLFLAERPTLRERLQRRRWWRLTLADWGAVLAIVVLSGIAPGQLLRLARTWPPAQQPWGEALALALAAILGCLAGYTLLRRLISDLRQAVSGLSDLGLRATDMSRSLLDEVRGMVDQQAAKWAATADTYQARIDALAQEITAQRSSQPGSIDLRGLSQRSAELQAAIAELVAGGAARDGEIDKLVAEHADIRAQADALDAEIARLLADQQRRAQRRLALDATDQQILDLLTADPGLTDEEIGRHPKVALERSQVTRRRNRLAAAGYAAAQKRQGQRPGTR